MRRVTQIAIGYGIAAFVLTLTSRTTTTWVVDHITRHPGEPLTNAQMVAAWISNEWSRYGPWITLLVAVVLGAVAFLTRPRRDSAAISAEDVDPSPAVATPPRVWPSLLAGVFGFPLATAGGIALIALFIIMKSIASGAGLPRAILADGRAFAASPGGFLLLATAMELALLLIVLRVAMRSAVPLRERLALHPPRLRWWAWPLLATATLAAGTAGMIVIGTLTGEPPAALLERMEALAQLRGPLAVAALLAVSIPPGVAEELLFRGYVQSRFVRRWGAPLAILLAGVLFALAHGDLLYSALVFPLGIWLGWVAWFTRSVIPAMLCHAVNNLVRVATLMVVGEPVHGWFTWDAMTIATLVVSLAIVAASIVAMRAHGRLPDAQAPAGVAG
jgi:membrane protease YdiL (CAAX protease family)